MAVPEQQPEGEGISEKLRPNTWYVDGAGSGPTRTLPLEEHDTV